MSGRFRVVELPAIGPVPFAGMLLADLGAEVVRIDKLAATGPFDALPAGPLGRGRRSIAVDVRRPGGAEVVLRLCANADLLIEGFRPGVAERLGVGPDDVHARNPQLVYGRMTGWGQHGPLAQTAGHDITYLAVSGVLHGIGPADGPPVPPVNYVADFGGGAMFLVTGLLAALTHARTSGQGQVVDAAMTEGAAYLASMTRTFLAAGGWTDRRGSNLLDGGAPNYRCYACADGRYVAVGALEPQFWAALVDGLGLTDVPSPYDPAQWPACADALEAAFARRGRDEWAEHFAATDACVAPVLTLDEAPHPPAQRRTRLVRASRRGGARRGGAAVLGDGHARRALTPVGRDTAALLAELGYDAAAVDELRAAQTIA